MDVNRLLQHLAELYETPDFLREDPGRFMHEVQGICNQELTALLASSLSYGMRRFFMPKISRLVVAAGGDVAGWVRSGAFASAIPDDGATFYRLTSNHQLLSFLRGARQLLTDYGSVGSYVRACATDAPSALEALIRYFAAYDASSLIPRSSLSACKRLCMFLRWMVRSQSPVDLGLWADFIDRCTLVMPLDTHVLTTARALRLIGGRTPSMSLARRLTLRMLTVFPDDPLRGDFALYGLGVSPVATTDF